jgi:AAA family ATP:ADP antiporter
MKTNVTHKLIRFLWGDLEPSELKKFTLLAAGFFFLLGSWWPLKTLKESIFINMIGPMHLPEAKIASVLLFFPIVLLYSKLVDHFAKEKLIYFFVGFYTIVGLVLVYFLYHPTIGLANTQVDPSRMLGWAFYLFVESYISLMLSLYWSFINDVTTPESAKKGYGLIIFGTQLGAFLFIILGNILSYDTTRYAERAPFIALISILTFLAMPVIVYIMTKTVEKNALTGYSDQIAQEEAEPLKKDSWVGFLDGLKLLVTHPYVTGIFFLICFQELISTLMGFQMSLLVNATYTDPGARNFFFFNFALAVQLIACLFGLFGTSFFQRRFGIRFCLITYPVLLGLAIAYYMVFPTLTTIFSVMLIAKALNYAFNQPAKEVLYIPTSRSIKYKSKAWIDMFGMRFAKAAGSIINRLMGPYILLIGTSTLGIIGLWTLLANVIGNVFKKAVDENKLIE